MSGVAAMLPFDDWQSDGSPEDVPPVLAVPAMSTEGSDACANPHRGGQVIMSGVAVGVGGRAAVTGASASRSDTAAVDDRPAGSRLSAEAIAWGRVQAAKAPVWSVEKRRRVAALLGLVLAERGG